MPRRAAAVRRLSPARPNVGSAGKETVVNPPFDPVAAITEHSRGLARAAEGNLAARVEHCPDWSVADLVNHLTQTHWFWTTIVDRHLTEEPDESERPPRAEPDRLIPEFLAGADWMARVLSSADPATRVWTWSPHQRDAAFVTRHQVQEAAVHHWDAVNAAGGELVIASDVAADAVDEQLTFSLSGPSGYVQGEGEDLGGRFALRCADADADADAAWTVRDGDRPRNLVVEPGVAPEVPAITATASDLLLWTYRRVDLNTGPVPADLAARFRASLTAVRPGH